MLNNKVECTVQASIYGLTAVVYLLERTKRSQNSRYLADI